jgi:hypothetical protein
MFSEGGRENIFDEKRKDTRNFEMAEAPRSIISQRDSKFIRHPHESRFEVRLYTIYLR